jgi:hypothetical protein
MAVMRGCATSGLLVITRGGRCVVYGALIRRGLRGGGRIITETGRFGDEC